jgi:uncharacterized protein YggE
VKVLVLMTTLLLLAATAAAQEPLCSASPPSTRVTGQATVTARPDQAELDLGVVTQAPTAQAAATQNAQQLDAVVAAVHKALGPSAPVETLNYTLSSNYRPPQEGGQPVLTGYTATNTVQVKTEKPTEVGTVIDLALQAGADHINCLQFTLKNEQLVQAQALREAAVKARAQADALAAALGLKLGRVLSVTEGEPVIVLPRRDLGVRTQAEALAAPTPVEPGRIEVHASVALTVEIGQ